MCLLELYFKPLNVWKLEFGICRLLMHLSYYEEINNIGPIYRGYLLCICNHIQNYLRSSPYLRKFILSSGKLYMMINGIIKVWTKRDIKKDTHWELKKKSHFCGVPRFCKAYSSWGKHSTLLATADWHHASLLFILNSWKYLYFAINKR